MQKEEAMENLRRVIFLDIDGVIQPHSSQKRFRHDLKKLREELAAKYEDDAYLEMDRYDLGAIFHDWDKEAVERLRKLCTEGDAEIVISSDWRFYSPLWRLKFYFRLHDLDQHITGEIPQTSGKYRCGQVTEYLDQNPDVERFVILDDSHTKDFGETYPDQFVYCYPIFDDEGYEKALNILTGK